MFNINFDINEWLLKKWPTKLGYLLTAILIIFIILTTEYLFIQVIGKSIPTMPAILIVLLTLLTHDVFWRLKTGRIIFFWFNKILIAIHPNVLKENSTLEKVLISLIKDGDIGYWFKIFVLPEDFIIDDNKKAETYVINKKIDLLIWGETISGSSVGKEATDYRIRFSGYFNYPAAQPSVKALLIGDFNELVREKYWRVNQENSLPDILTLGGNIAEVGLYIIAICLLSRGNVAGGLNILEQLFFKMKDDPLKRKLSIYPKVKNHLISLYNLLSFVAWREENNEDKSMMLANKALNLDENNYDCNARMALYEYLNGNILGSRKHVKKCKKINPRHPCTIFDQAFFYILDKQYNLAAKRYKKLETCNVDGLMAFEVVFFLEEEYKKNKMEIGFLFAAGYVNFKFVEHKEIGLRQLRQFCKLARDRTEYKDFYNKAYAIINERGYTAP